MEAASDGGPTRRAGAVAFVSDFRHVAVSFERLAQVALEPRAQWLARLSDRPAFRPHRRQPDGVAAAGSASAVVRVGAGRGPLRRPVVVTLGPPRPRGRAVIVPLRWSPARLESLLPELDGDLELAAIDDESCRLGLSGRYRAPMEAVGWALDRVALRWVAEASVRDFLEAVEAVWRELSTPC